jgi:hypothetical protein
LYEIKVTSHTMTVPELEKATVKAKKPRSEKQIAAFAKAREARALNLKTRKDLVADCIAKGIEVPPPKPRRRKIKKAALAPVEEEESSSEGEAVAL